MTQGDLFKPPFFFSVIYYDGRKSKVREFSQLAQMIMEANDLLKNDPDVMQVSLAERRNGVPYPIRVMTR